MCKGFGSVKDFLKDPDCYQFKTRHCPKCLQFLKPEQFSDACNLCLFICHVFLNSIKSPPDSTTQQRRRTSCREFCLGVFSERFQKKNCLVTLSSYISSSGYQNIICFIVFQWHFPGHDGGPLGFFSFKIPTWASPGPRCCGFPASMVEHESIGAGCRSWTARISSSKDGSQERDGPGDVNELLPSLKQIALENGWLEDYLPFRTAYFQVRTVSFRDSSWLIDCLHMALFRHSKNWTCQVCLVILLELGGFQQIFWIFTPILGEIIKLTHIFEENIRKPPTSNELHPQSSMSCHWKPCRDFGFGMAQFFRCYTSRKYLLILVEDLEGEKHL